jgi:hypothetical protein
MKHFFSFILFIFLTTTLTSCSTHTIYNRNGRETLFSDIKTDYSLIDVNHYGCESIDLTVLEHILENGTFVTEKELHDQYSTTGCTIEGSVKINNNLNEFVYDYGGIIYFSNGKILACGESCCRDNYPNCSWDKQNLKGF